MTRPRSRVRSHAAFMEVAKQMYERMEDWYDEHPKSASNLIPGNYFASPEFGSTINTEVSTASKSAPVNTSSW